jgi:hypothetical protein
MRVCRRGARVEAVASAGRTPGLPGARKETVVTDQPREPGEEQEDASTEQEQGVDDDSATGTSDPRTGQDDGGARSGDRYSGTES